MIPGLQPIFEPKPGRIFSKTRLGQDWIVGLKPDGAGLKAFVCQLVTTQAGECRIVNSIAFNTEITETQRTRREFDGF